MKDDLNITSVRLSGKAFEIKKELAPVYGLRNILSAGLILFGRLSSDQQKQVIAESNGVDISGLSGIYAYRWELFRTKFENKSVGKKKRDALRRKYHEDEALSEDEKKLLDDLFLMFDNLPEDKRAGLWKAPEEFG